MHSRLRDKSLGFLLTLAATGKKVQVIQSSYIVSGLVSGPGKMKAMEEFKSRLHNNSGLFSFPSPSYIRTSGILFCTDVCSMGVDIPDLVVGVSLGKLTTIHVTDA